MKKATIALVFVLLASSPVFAQQNYFRNGDKVFNLGIGLGSSGYFGGNNSTSLPPVSLSFETGVKDGIFGKGVLGLGGYTSLSSYKFENDHLTSKSVDFILAGRCSLHYPFMEKLDTYGGIMLGADIVSTEASLKNSSDYYSIDTPGTNAGFKFALYVGGRYCFSEKISAFAELGYGIAILNIGFSYKL